MKNNIQYAPIIERRFGSGQIHLSCTSDFYSSLDAALSAAVYHTTGVHAFPSPPTAVGIISFYPETGKCKAVILREDMETAMLQYLEARLATPERTPRIAAQQDARVS